MTRADFREAVRQECASYEARAGEYDACRQVLSVVRGERDHCRGSALVLETQQNQLRVDLANVTMERDEALARERARISPFLMFTIGLVAGAAIVGGGVVWLTF